MSTYQIRQEPAVYWMPPVAVVEKSQDHGVTHSMISEDGTEIEGICSPDVSRGDFHSYVGEIRRILRSKHSLWLKRRFGLCIEDDPEARKQRLQAAFDGCWCD